MIMSLITLLTDFGLEDNYVGVMKGVIKKINSEVSLIDITHNIPPQNIIAGRFMLMNSIPYFPDQTIHIVVVDPGVGSQRRGLIIKFEKGYIITPDNGLISGIFEEDQLLEIIEIKNTKYWLTSSPSFTFHGRDIFAPVGAYLSKGIPLKNFGNPIDIASLIKLNFPDYQETNQGIIGYIQYIDHFGNLITNIPEKSIKNKSWILLIKNIKIPRKNTYNNSKIGEVISLIGSHGFLEIAVNQGNAQIRLNLKIGDQLELWLENNG